jgi:hypothetical protein
MAPESPQQSSPSRDDWDDHWASLGNPALKNPGNDSGNKLIFRMQGAAEPGSVVIDIASGQDQLALVTRDVFRESRVIGIWCNAEGVKRFFRAVAESGLQLPTHDDSPSHLPKRATATCSDDLYRLAVMARGRKLIANLRDELGGRPASTTQQWMAKVCGVAFRLNPTRSRLGWQMVAVT